MLLNDKINLNRRSYKKVNRHVSEKNDGILRHESKHFIFVGLEKETATLFRSL